MTVHGLAVDYLEGTLGPEEEIAFLDHVADCVACQTALIDDLQLRDLEERARRHTAISLLELLGVLGGSVVVAALLAAVAYALTALQS